MPVRKWASRALLAALLLSTAAWPQYPGGPGGSRSGTGGSRAGGRPDAARGGQAAEVPSSPNALAQTELDRLEDDFKLAPAQRSAWDAYADSVLKLGDEVTRMRFETRTEAPAPAGAPDQLDRIAKGVHGRTAMVDQIVAAGRAFYATLTPEQKAIADRRLTLPLALLATGVAPPGAFGGGGRNP